MSEERLARAREVNQRIRHQRSAIGTTIPRMMNEGMITANGDTSKARAFVAALGESTAFLEARDWEAGMTTAPGELVKDPQGKYTYVYSGKTVMTHANPTYFPGAAGVYYWIIVPEIFGDVKVYPDISGIIVAVRKDEVWWNTEKTQKFRWKGADNPNCVWPPAAGNEWGAAE